MVGRRFELQSAVCHKPFPAPLLATTQFCVSGCGASARKWLSGVSTVARRQSMLQLPTSFVRTLNYMCEDESHKKCDVMTLRRYIGTFRGLQHLLYSGEKRYLIKSTRHHNPEVCDLNIQMNRRQCLSLTQLICIKIILYIYLIYPSIYLSIKCSTSKKSISTSKHQEKATED